jgi:hypothetical protein
MSVLEIFGQGESDGAVRVRRGLWDASRWRYVEGVESVHMADLLLFDSPASPPPALTAPLEAHEATVLFVFERHPGLSAVALDHGALDVPGVGE